MTSHVRSRSQSLPKTYGDVTDPSTSLLQSWDSRTITELVTSSFRYSDGKNSPNSICRFIVLAVVSLLLLGTLTYLPLGNLAAVEGTVEFNREKAFQSGWLLHSEEYARSGANGSCITLQERHLYYPRANLKPSEELITALREYEAMHRKCVMEVFDWPNHFKSLQGDLRNCKYLIWKPPTGGLGNRFVSLAGAFEYALLTNRAILVEKLEDIERLLCNPLEGSSIFLPDNFPLADLETAPHIDEFMKGKTSSWGKRDTKRKDIAFAFLQHFMREEESTFFCEKVQDELKKVPWLIFESNQYIGPALFFVPSFEGHLLKLFPDRVTTSHVARYLLLPTNKVWKRITTVYKAYFGFVSKKIGVQIRTFGDYKPIVSERIIQCLGDNSVLVMEDSKNETKAEYLEKVHKNQQMNQVNVLFVTSLDYEFYRDLKKAYTEKRTVDDSVVAVHSESHEGHEIHSLDANQKAIVEMWLLSMTDTLLVSDGSTFGYVANALHGQHEAFFMHNHEGQWEEGKTPVCSRTWTSSSCYHVPPKKLNCEGGETEKIIDGKPTLEYIRSCQDSSFGIQVIPAM